MFPYYRYTCLFLFSPNFSDINHLLEADEHFMPALFFISCPEKSLRNIESSPQQLLLFSFAFLVDVDVLESSVASWST